MTEPYPKYALAHGWSQEAVIPPDMQNIETVCLHLVDSPPWFPHWQQYAFSAVRLTDDLPGFQPVRRVLPGATHELIIMVIDPEQAGYPFPDPLALTEAAKTTFPYLLPPNLAAQFVATDDEMRALVKLAVISTITGGMNPEPYSPLPRRTWGPFLASALDDIRKSLAQGSTDENR